MARGVPNPEWVLMYRRGLTRSRIADLLGAPASKVGYHLAAARKLEPGLFGEHEAAIVRKKGQRVTHRGLESMNQLIDFVHAEGRYPAYSAASPKERALAQWLQERRRNAAAGTLAPIFRENLQALPGWETNQRRGQNESRWQERLAALVDYRAQGQEWPRHKKTVSEDEHTLGVWLHVQRYKLRRGDLDVAKLETLDRYLPGWREGRRRGRRPRE